MSAESSNELHAHCLKEKVVDTASKSPQLRVILVALQKEGPSFSLGIHSLASYASQHCSFAHITCMDLSIIDYRQQLLRRLHPNQINWSSITPLDWLLRAVERIRPDVLGISAKWGSINELRNLFTRLAKFETPQLRNLQIVVGNTEAIMNPAKVLDLASEVLPTTFRQVVVCTGEGEETFCQILQDAHDLWPTRVHNIPNLAFMDPISGELVTTFRKTVDVSKIPPLNRSSKHHIEQIIDIAESGSEAYLYVTEAVRGCGYGHSEETACSFCAIQSYQFGSVRGLPLSTVVSNLSFLDEIQSKHRRKFPVYFPDWDFMDYGLARIQKLAQAISEMNIGAPLVFATRADRIVRQRNTSEVISTLEHLRQAGLIGIFVGIDSGTQTVLNRIGKGLSVDINEQAIRLLRGERIQDHQLPGGPLGAAFGYITFADPLISPEEVAEQLSFLERMDLLAHEVNAFKTIRLQVGMNGMVQQARDAKLIRGLRNSLEFDYVFGYPRVQAIVQASRRYLAPTKHFRYLLRNLDGNLTFYHISHFPPEYQDLAYWVYGLRKLELDFILDLLSDTEQFSHIGFEAEEQLRQPLISLIEKACIPAAAKLHLAIHVAIDKLERIASGTAVLEHLSIESMIKNTRTMLQLDQ